MTGLRFGTGGVPLSSTSSSTISGIQRIHELGLGCMEIEFVQGVTMGETTAREVARVAGELGVALSVHAPYFINFNSDDAEKRRGSARRLLRSAHIGVLCGARSVIFHPAFYLGSAPEKVYDTVRNELNGVLGELKAEGNRICLRPEITGKNTQFGTLEETLNLCRELPGLLPCLDIAHWHARTGAFNTHAEVTQALKLVESRLGRGALSDMHFHFSGISYSSKGEIKHLPLKESDMNYLDILKALKNQGVKGLVICESPNLEEDALLLKGNFESLPRKPE